MTKKIIGLSVVLVVLLAGCSTKSSKEMGKEIDKEMKQSMLYKNAVSEKKYSQERKKAIEIIEKELEASFFKEDVYTALKAISEKLNVNLDESFKPDSSYKITTNFKGTLREFLRKIYVETGIKYKYRNGMLKITNKLLISEAKSIKICKIGAKPTITMSFVDTPAIDIFKYFSTTYGFNFAFNLRFKALKENDLKAQRNPNERPRSMVDKVSLFYSGCDEKEAFFNFLDAIDFTATETKKNKFKVQDYMTETIDVATYFKYAFESGATMGDEEASASGNKVSIEEDEMTNTKEYVKKFLSTDGIINMSNRGVLTLMDYPSRIKDINRLLQKEKSKQTPMKLSISILSITMNDSLETSANLNLSLEKLLDSPDGTSKPALSLGGSSSTNTQGITVNGKKNGLLQVFNALQKIGKTKIVREYVVNTRNGLMNTFRAVERIPYVTTTTTAATSSTQTNVEAKFATSGVIINILPQLAEGGETVNMAVDILISEYLGDKVFNSAQGEITLPRITENEIQAPIRLKMEESMILTGFNTASDNSNKNGVPWLINHGTAQSNRLFGDVGDVNRANQLIVVISLSRIEDF